MSERYNRERLYIWGFVYVISIFVVVALLLFGCDKYAWGDEVNMDKIAQIESSGNPLAYNKGSGAKGLYQITEICLEDYFIFNPCCINLFNEDDNLHVADWYMNERIPQLLKHYGYDDTVRNRLIAYNCGITCVGKKLPNETVNYISKYFRR